jgi:hypothetical protein
MLILLAALATAADTPPPAQGVKDADPIVCKRPHTSDVGTHMRPKPVCMKKSDWEYTEKNTQNELDRLRDRGSIDPGKVGAQRPQ